MAVRRYRKSRKMNKKKSSAKPRTKVDKNLSRRIKKLEHAPEVKYKDYTDGTTPTPSGNAYSLVSAISDGNNVDQRIGNRISLKKVRMAFRVSTSGETINIPFSLRLILLYDTQSNADFSLPLFVPPAPTSTEYSTGLIDTSGGMIATLAPYNENTKSRYKILYDKRMTNQIFTNQAEQLWEWSKTISLNNAIIQYSDSNIGQASIPSRNLLFVYFSSFTTANPGFQATFRVFYTDQ